MARATLLSSYGSGRPSRLRTHFGAGIGTFYGNGNGTSPPSTNASFPTRREARGRSGRRSLARLSRGERVMAFHLDLGLAPPSEVRVRSSTPGRLRLAVPGLRWNEVLAQKLEERLHESEGVLDVTVTLATGHVLVIYDPARTDPGRLETGARELAPPAPARRTPATAAWHALSVDEVLERVEATRDGLTPDEALRRLREVGPNAVIDVKPRSSLRLALEQLASRPVLLLSGASGLSFVIGDTLEGVAMALAVATNVAIGFTTERRAEELIRGFKGSAPRLARVRRAGRELDVPATTLVPGDVLLLRANDFVAADARVLESHDLQVDESALTGESVPVAKDPEPRKPRAVLAKRADLVFRGTVVVSGEGEAVVVATGPASEMGRIARAIREAEPPATPLEKELDHLSRRLEVLGLAGTVAVSFLGIVRGRPLGRVVRSAIALGVAAIPEGLPATATTALALSMWRLRGRGIVIRRLAAAETLGSADVICADKTGTLTLNKMRVEDLWAPSNEARERLLLVLALSNDVRRGGEKLVGSATERALIERAAMERSIDRLEEAWEKISSRPRRPGVARTVTVHRSPTGEVLALAKGSPDAVREILREPSLDAELERRNAALADEGKRVLAAAWRRLGDDWSEDDLGRDFELAGLVALADPLREDAAATIEAARSAGIRCVIVTGDQVETARAIARRCGLPVGPGSVIEADALERLPRDRWDELAVVARASPEDKLALVRVLQENGHVVAMAGDGVNDAIALRAADVGVALATRTQALPVALADVVLATESLQGVLDAVAEGRRLRDNIRRAAQYLIATNASEILLVLGASVLGLDDPLTPLQLLWINLLGDTAPALALALEPLEEDVLARPPVPPGEHLIT